MSGKGTKTDIRKMSQGNKGKGKGIPGW